MGIYQPKSALSFHDLKTDISLAPGTKSDDIRELQERLKTLGFLTKDVTGVVDRDTIDSLVRFQYTRQSGQVYPPKIQKEINNEYTQSSLHPHISYHGTLTAINIEISKKAKEEELQLQKIQHEKEVRDAILHEPCPPPFNPQLTAQQIGELHGHDPKRVIFNSHDKKDPVHYDSQSNQLGDYSPSFINGDIKMLGNPTVYNLNSAKEGVHDSGVVLRTLEEHVKKYGTIKEFVINGHGRTNNLGSTATLNLPEFLEDLKIRQQKLGFKFADRIVFDSCDTMQNLDKHPESIVAYKAMAKGLGAEIVGASTRSFANGEEQSGGRFVKFSPNGAVSWDKKMDSPDYLIKHASEELQTAIFSPSKLALSGFRNSLITSFEEVVGIGSEWVDPQIHKHKNTLGGDHSREH